MASNFVRALKKGASLPAPTPGKIQFITMRFCPFAQRVRLVLEHKKIPYDIVYVSLIGNLPEEVTSMNPNGQVPIIRHDGKVLYESLAIMQYLDDVFPNNRLTIQEPYTKAKHTVLTTEMPKVFSPFYSIFYAKPGADEAKEWNNLLEALQMYEDELSGDYFGGGQPGMLDLSLWPWLERLPVLSPGKLKLPADRLPRMYGWVSRMYNQPAVQNTILDDKSHIFFRDRQRNLLFGNTSNL